MTTARFNRSNPETEKRIVDFLRWVHHQTTAPQPQRDYVTDAEGYTLFPSLSSKLKEEWGFVLTTILPVMRGLGLVVTDYQPASLLSIIRIKWASSINVDRDADILPIAQQIRVMMSVRRKSQRKHIPETIHLTTPVTTLKVEEEARPLPQIPKPEPVKRQHAEIDLIMWYIKEAMTEKYTIHIEIPEIGLDILLYKKGTSS